MRHLTDGTLRRMVDEPLSMSAGDRQHFTKCLRCQGRFETISSDADAVAALLPGPSRPADPALGLARFRAQVVREGIEPAASERGLGRVARRIRGRLVKPASGVAFAAALVGALTLTPAGSLAQQFFTVFQPRQIAEIPVTTQELMTLPKLAKFGTVHAPARVPNRPVSGPAAASSVTGMHVLQPGALPSGVPSAARYDVVPSATGTFTFSAAKAQAEAAAEGKTLPPMPASVDGSTLRVTTGAAAVAVYGAGKQNDMPSLVVGQMRAPTVTSTRASVKQLEDYILSLPGVSPQLASAIRSIGDPTAILPIPVPIDRARATTVHIQGAQGLAIGDSTGLGSAVIWEKNGIVYGVAGSLTEDQVLGIASSLH